MEDKKTGRDDEASSPALPASSPGARRYSCDGGLETKQPPPQPTLTRSESCSGADGSEILRDGTAGTDGLRRSKTIQSSMDKICQDDTSGRKVHFSEDALALLTAVGEEARGRRARSLSLVVEPPSPSLTTSPTAVGGEGGPGDEATPTRIGHNRIAQFLRHMWGMENRKVLGPEEPRRLLAQRRGARSPSQIAADLRALRGLNLMGDDPPRQPGASGARSPARSPGRRSPRPLTPAASDAHKTLAAMTLAEIEGSSEMAASPLTTVPECEVLGYTLGEALDEVLQEQEPAAPAAPPPTPILKAFRPTSLGKSPLTDDGDLETPPFRRRAFAARLDTRGFGLSPSGSPHWESDSENAGTFEEGHSMGALGHDHSMAVKLLWDITQHKAPHRQVYYFPMEKENDKEKEKEKKEKEKDKEKEEK